MNIYILGNQDLSSDNQAFKAAEYFQHNVPDKNLEFITIKPNQDLPFVGEKRIVIMDVVEGINEVQVFNEDDLDNLVLPPRTSVHDFDLGFQLKYLKKLGKLEQITIIGLPMNEEIGYDLIHSILRKLVAQDIHGS